MRSPSLTVLRLAAEMTIKQTFSDGFILFTVLVQPLLVALMGLWMLQGKGPEYGIFVVVGSGMTSLWSGTLFMSGNAITQERWTGTLETLAGVPADLRLIVLGKNLAHVIQSLLAMAAAYLLASVLLGYPLSIAMPLPFAVGIVAVVVSLAVFGLVISPLFMITPAMQQWQNGLEFPVYILSGFLFPVALLPIWTFPLRWLLPTYWAARALHGAAEGGITPGELWLCWGALTLGSALWAIVSGGLFRALIAKAKRDATLDLQ